MNETESTGDSLEKSSSFTSSREGKEKKVAFKTSYPSANLEQNVPERDTPITNLKDFSAEVFSEKRIKPDISFYCKHCESYINLVEYHEHKEYHDSLEFFGLKSLPKTEDELRELRKSLVDSTFNKYLKKQKDLESSKSCEWSAKIAQINAAYEIIMSYVDNTFEFNKHISDASFKYEIHGESDLSINESILAIGFGSEQNKQHRQKMEDTFLILEKFGESDNLTYFSLFDGYDGETASNKCVQQLHLALLYKLNQLNSNIEFINEKYIYDEINHLEKYAKQETDIQRDEISKDSSNLSEEELENRKFHQAFIYGYHQMDKLLSRGKDETSKVRWSGATATTFIIENKTETDEGWIHIANCGDVEAIVVLKEETHKQKNYKVLTRLHTLNTYPKDRERIERNNGKIIDQSGVKRLEGLYNITRGFGFHGDRNVKKFISATPSIKSYKVEPNYACLIVATKGLWNTLNYKTVSDLVIEALKLKPIKNNPATSPSVYELANKNKTTDDESLLSSSNSNRILEEDSFELRKKTGNLFGAYRNNLRNMSSTPTEFKINGLDEDSDEVFYVVPRPKSTPHELLKLEIAQKKSKKKKNQANDLNENKKIYSSSDIYPVKKSHALMNQHHDLRLDINDIKDITMEDINLQINSKQFERETLETKFVDLKYKSIQVNDYDIKRFARNVMENRQDAKRLELTELVVEKLIVSALLAGSKDNITINCILLPGSDL